MKQLKWLEFSLLQNYSKVFHSVYLRHGGVSKGRFESLNVSESVGDNLAHVMRNREIIQNHAALSKLVFLNQVHGTKIVEASSDLVEADGLFTKERGVGLVIKHADCQAALFFDPVNEVIGAIHAGWRGLSQNIYSSAVTLFKEKFNSRLEDLIVCISPSLGPDHSEFVNYKKELPQEFLNFRTRPNYFDLWEAARFQLLKAGVKKQNLEIAKVCTFSNPDDYFSFRRDRETGRHATVIALR